MGCTGLCVAQIHGGESKEKNLLVCKESKAGGLFPDWLPITQILAVTRRLQACVGQAATEALSVIKDKS